MACFNVTHLVRRGGVYCFRMAVPHGLVKQFGRREIKGSLKTTDPITAKMRCRELSNAFERLIESARTMPELTPETITGLIQSYFQRCLNTSEEIALLAPTDRDLDLDAEVEGLRSQQEALRQALGRRTYDQITRLEASEVLEGVGMSTSSVGMEAFDRICNGVLRARIEDRRILVAKLLGQYEHTMPADPMFAGMQPTGLPLLPGEANGSQPDARTVTALADRYCDLKQDKVWVAKTYNENRRVLNLFIELVGGTRPIASLGLEDVRRFRDTLLKLPSNYMKSKEMQGKPLAEVLAAEKGGAVLANKTGEKYFQNLKAFLKWAVNEGYLNAIPGGGLKMPGVSKADAQEARYPFSPEQLQALFASPMFTGCKSPARRTEPGTAIIRDGKFWVPLIALFSGMRLGEIVQLLVTDIKEHEGIAYFDISRGEGEDKQLKTASSRRDVPLHPVLIRIGLLQHVEQQRKANPKGRIFPDIEPGADGYFSALYSKWFSRYATNVKVKTPKTSFHSFRHCFKDALVIAGVEESRRRALMGHSDDSVHGQYGSKLPIPVLAEALYKVVYQVVSLDQLYVSSELV